MIVENEHGIVEIELGALLRVDRISSKIIPKDSIYSRDTVALLALITANINLKTCMIFRDGRFQPNERYILLLTGFYYSYICRVKRIEYYGEDVRYQDYKTLRDSK